MAETMILAFTTHGVQSEDHDRLKMLLGGLGGLDVEYFEFDQKKKIQSLITDGMLIRIHQRKLMSLFVTSTVLFRMRKYFSKINRLNDLKSLTFIRVMQADVGKRAPWILTTYYSTRMFY